MSTFTGKQHVAAAFKRTFTDRVPYYPILGHFNAKLASISVREFLTDSEKFARAQVLVYETFHPDIMEQAAKSCIEVAAKESAFILSTGCEVPYVAAPEQIRWFMEATEKYGYYGSFE